MTQTWKSLTGAYRLLTLPGVDPWRMRLLPYQQDKEKAIHNFSSTKLPQLSTQYY